MNNFNNLLRLQFLSFLGLNKAAHSKKRKFFNGLSGAVLLMVLFVAALVGGGYIYAEMFGDIISLTTGNLLELPALMIGIAALVGFIFTFSSVGTNLYAFKDYEMLSAMPVKQYEIVFAKLTFMYLGDLIFTALLSLPSLFVYAKLGGALSFDIVLIFSALVILSPFMPMAISIVIGAVTSVIASLFRKKNLIQTIMLLAVFGGIFAASYSFGYNSAAGVLDMTGSIGKIYFILPWVIWAFSKPIFLLWFALVNIGSIALITVAVCLTYSQFNTLISTKRTLRNFKLKTEYASRSVFSTLYRREMARFFSLPMYFINCIIGVIMTVFLTVIFVVLFTGFSEIATVGKTFALFAPVVYSFALLLSPTTNCSISLEGGAFWVMKTAPVNMNTLFHAKLAVNATFNGIVALASSIALSIALKLSFGMAMLTVLTAVLIALLGGNIGLLANILLPKFTWETPNQVVKQGAATFITVISAFACVAAFVVVAIYVNLVPEAVMAINLGIVIILNFAFYLPIILKGEYLLGKKY